MRKRLVVFGMIGALALGGCGAAALPDMTDEQAQMIGEYAAMTLLKYDANSRSRLVDLALYETPESEEPVPEVTQPPEEPAEPEQPEQTVPETPVIEIGESQPEAKSLESFLELPEGVTIQFVGGKVCQSYPEDGNDFFALEAAPGKQLLVLDFQISNQSGMAQTIRLLERRDLYRITVNDVYTRTALTTMLTNDLSTYEGTLESGERRGVVLLVEIDLQQTGTPSSVVLSLKNNEEIYKTQLM